MLERNHYVISPGAYGQSLLRGTRSAGQIQGVVGCWATVPNVEPRLGLSLKVARRGHVTEDANITVGRDETGSEVLLVGSGYGWTGADPANINPGELAVIYG